MPIKVFMVEDRNIIEKAFNQLQIQKTEVVRVDDIADIYDCFDEIFEPNAKIIIINPDTNNSYQNNEIYQPIEDVYVKSDVDDNTNSLQDKLIDLTSREIEVLK